MNEYTKEDAFYSKVFYTLLMIAAFILIIALFITATRLLFLLLLAVLIGIPLRTSGTLLARYLPINAAWGVIVSATIFAGLIFLVGQFTGPELITRSDELLQVAEQTIDRSEKMIRNTTIGQQALERLENADQTNVFRLLPDPYSTVTEIFSGIITPIFTIIVLYVLGIMFAIKPRDYIQLFTRMFPDEHHGTVEETFRQLDHALGWWLLARTTSVFVIGALTYIGLLILGTPLAITLAVLAGLLSFIPNIGPLLSIIPAALVGASVSWNMMIYVIILYVCLQTLESYLITPYVEKRTVSLPPALTISVQALLTLLVGLVGALVAAPLLVILMILGRTIYFPYVLNKDPEQLDYHIG